MNAGKKFNQQARFFRARTIQFPEKALAAAIFLDAINCIRKYYNLGLPSTEQSLEVLHALQFLKHGTGVAKNPFIFHECIQLDFFCDLSEEALVHQVLKFSKQIRKKYNKDKKNTNKRGRADGGSRWR